MQNNLTRHVDSLLALPRGAKKTLAVMTDAALCVLTVWLAICFRFESWVSLAGYQWFAVVLSVLLAIPLLTAFGFYHTVIRYAGRQTVIAALRAIAVYALLYSAVFTAYGLPLVPRTIGLLQPMLLLISLALTRLLASQLLADQIEWVNHQENLPTVVIYGAGQSGQQLAASIQMGRKSRVVGFIDDNSNLHNAQIAGVPVSSPTRLDALVQRYQVQDVLLAMPNLSRSQRNSIIKGLSNVNVAVRTLPNLGDLAQGKVSQSDLRELDIEDLLGRDPVKPIEALLARNITGKTVLVTGAGGSIGSELCRQIQKLKPQKIVLIDSNEFGLYRIGEELEAAGQLHSTSASLVLSLLNVQNLSALEAVVAAHRPNTIYHAAAYKHVPMIEANPVIGLQNNVMGTFNVAQCAKRFCVDDMVLISSDKAVRPTNVMGASKRISELVLQEFAFKDESSLHETRYSIVRFGNVLGSSGSVIPKFREQIEAGGPITLTHPEVTRYFMTIPEAALLVIQASAMRSQSKNNTPVYLLDMGDSVKILDLAKTLIKLSGHSVRDASNIDGSIEIQYIGLRPGEKLFEELLISTDALKTQHPKIMVANDAGEVDSAWLTKTLDSVQSLKVDASAEAVQQLLADPMIGYTKNHD
jgi:FlaA1/EpsC-like NDP-sugar epimerase